MDQKLLKSHDHKDSIKKAMLKHEEIFKDQVQELHRLYRKQKLLMDNRSTTRQPTRQKIEETGDLDSKGAIKESEIELTLGPSTYKSNQNRSSSGQSFSSSNSTGSSQIHNKDIAPTPSTSRKDSTWEFTRSSQNSVQMNLGEEHLRQDMMKQHPSWMFQPLTLRLT